MVHRKMMILFTEPSHFALVFLPILLYVTYVKHAAGSKKEALSYILLTIYMILDIKNATLMAGLFIVIVILYARNIKYFLFFLLVIVIAAIATFDLQYFITRLTISMQTDNVSVLVFISGWERGYLSLIESYGVGLGFQQMGTGALGIAMEKIINMGLPPLNKYDGGTLGSKIVTELGVFGLLLIIVYVVTAIKVFVKMFLYRIDSYKEVFFYSIFIMMSVQIFIRGGGYFTPLTFMFFVSLYWIYDKNPLKINKT